MSRTILLILASVIVISACNKNDPQPNNLHEAMVLETRMIKISPDDWEPYGTSGDDTHGYSANATSNSLSQGIISDGVVQLHLKNNHGGWLELPATIYEQGSSYSEDWGFTYHLNGIRVTIDRNGEKVIPPDEPVVFRLSTGPKSSGETDLPTGGSSRQIAK